MNKRIVGIAAASSVLFFLSVSVLSADGMTLSQAVNGSWRSAAFKHRDQYRHPVETLKFFGIKPSMDVVELEPGGGWYTSILAPYLRAHGTLYDTVPPASSKGFMHQMRVGFLALLRSDPSVYNKDRLVPFAPPKITRLGPRDSADMVVTFRNLHDWEIAGVLRQVFLASCRVLKPGGIFGVVSHRARPFAVAKVSARKLHRMPEDYVLELALRTGFRLSGVSEVNDNPKDPETINVHRLPPDLAWGDTPAQKREYKKIGESDRMTFRFVKPGNDCRLPTIPASYRP